MLLAWFAVELPQQVEHDVVGGHAMPRFGASLRIHLVLRAGNLVEEVVCFKTQLEACVWDGLRNRAVDEPFCAVHGRGRVAATVVESGIEGERRTATLKGLRSCKRQAAVERTDRG